MQFKRLSFILFVALGLQSGFPAFAARRSPLPNPVVARVHVHSSASISQSPVAGAEIYFWDYDTGEYFGVYPSNISGNFDMTKLNFPGGPVSQRTFYIQAWKLDPTKTYYILAGSNLMHYTGTYIQTNVWVFPM